MHLSITIEKILNTFSLFFENMYYKIADVSSDKRQIYNMQQAIENL